MEEKKPSTGFTRSGEIFKEKGVFAHNQELVKIGDKIKAIGNVAGVIPEGTELEIEDIIVEPKAVGPGFTKRLKFKGLENNFNPKNFSKTHSKEN